MMKSSVGRLGKLGQAYAGRRLVAAASLSSQPYSGAVHGSQVTWTRSFSCLPFSGSTCTAGEVCNCRSGMCAPVHVCMSGAESVAVCVCTAGDLHLQREPHAQ